ncbi:MAG: hypothetical protein HY673_14710 [Chloroflexi bacterium]|nr:hypothetical protein [Chloroflexota bacterium]
MANLLSGNLDFACKSANNALHNFHSFPAKFPPELPRAFILGLTAPLDTVLDPMLGSGTTVLEAFLNDRRAIGFDIDPLALLISRVKTSSPDPEQLSDRGSSVVSRARAALASEPNKLQHDLEGRWDAKTKAFVDYWFLPQTQLELVAIAQEIDRICDLSVKEFLELTFSSIIITKSGGVSLAMDLGHTRPHKVTPVLEGSGAGKANKGKRLRSAVSDFEKRFGTNLRAMRMRPPVGKGADAQVHYGYSQSLPLRDESVDLIVTSPPYASNAIDYMRAHKFSLVWLGHSIEELAKQRTEYIGNERIKRSVDPLPPFSEAVVSEIAGVDQSKGKILHSYFCEIKLVIGEMFRVLRPGKAAIVVVGNSIFRGKSSYTAECLAEIGQSLGFMVPGVNKRNIDRNRRMMPIGNQVDLNSVVQQRMLQEHVIGFYKPC